MTPLAARPARLALAALVAIVLFRSPFPGPALGAAPEAAASPDQVATTLAPFEAAIGDRMRDWQTPGLAVAVVKDGKTVYAKGFGWRDLEKKLPVTPETLFPIGSCTKAFTAAALALLADEGRLDLDAPVRDAIPWFRMADEQATAGLTARDMLLHRSGLPRYDTFLVMRPDLSRRGLVEALRWLSPNKPLRYAFEYDNVMYAAAGFLLEQVCGQTWEAFVRERLFAPLGMDAALFSVAELQKSPEAAKPYLLKNGQPVAVAYADLDAVGPAGSIIANVRDMAKWLACNLETGRLGQTRVLPEKVMAEVHRPQIVIPGGPARPEAPFAAYALGWGVMPYRGRLLLTHDGETDGFRSSAAFLPDDGLGVVVLSNRSGDNELPGCAARGLIDLLLGLEPIAWSERALAGLAERQAAEKAEEQARRAATPKAAEPCRPLADYAGKYENPAYGLLAVATGQSGLRLAMAGETVDLALAASDVFTVRGGLFDGLRLRFAANDAGAADRILIAFEPGTPDVAFARLVEKNGTKTKQ